MNQLRGAHYSGLKFDEGFDISKTFLRLLIKSEESSWSAAALRGPACPVMTAAERSMRSGGSRRLTSSRHQTLSSCHRGQAPDRHTRHSRAG